MVNKVSITIDNRFYSFDLCHRLFVASTGFEVEVQDFRDSVVHIMEGDQGYMVKFAHEVKRAVPGTAVIAAGRIQDPEYASKIIEEGKTDLIGLARVLFADPLWPKKATGEIQGPIIACEPTCSLCMQRVMKGKPAYCSQWSKERGEAFLRRVEETG